MKYIYHHLGLGDHIICNGLVREVIQPTEEYSLFVKSHNLESVSFMFKDLKNLNFMQGDDNDVRTFLKEKKIKNSDLIIAGFYRHPMSKSFDESFYLQNNLDFKLRWESFKVQRDHDREKKIFDKFEIIENEYIFIHDDKTRNYEIDDLELNPKNLKIVRPSKDITENIFDYCLLIEKSIESHFIDSSFRLMNDSLGLKKENIFYHINMKNGIRRNSNEWDNSTSKLTYKII